MPFRWGSVRTSAIRRREARRAYEQWEKQAWRTLHDYLWLLRQWRELVPESPDDVQDERFVYSLHHLDYAEYLCDEFIRADSSGKLAMRGTVQNIEMFMRRKVHRFRSTGRGQKKTNTPDECSSSLKCGDPYGN